MTEITRDMVSDASDLFAGDLSEETESVLPDKSDEDAAMGAWAITPA